MADVLPLLTAREFSAMFGDMFAPAAAAAGLSRGKRKALAWTRQVPDGTTFAFGFRLNRKNMEGFPGEFAPDIVWSAANLDARDNGDVSFYQYATAQELDTIAALHRRVIGRFIDEEGLHEELANPRSLVRMLAGFSHEPIRPNHHRWLPYRSADDVRAWAELFSGSVERWIGRFLESPETLDAWCWRVLWSDRKRDGS
jgi:hypothetical protein